MKRSGFARAPYVSAPASPLKPLYRRVDYTNGGRELSPRPKEPRLENPHLLLMARMPGNYCLLRVPGICNGGHQGTCACHGNSSEYNKGLSIKAHDFFTVRGCARCHTWLDSSYSATDEERQLAFKAGLDRQIVEWRWMTTQPDVPKKDMDAIAWALRNLKERGYVA